MLVNVTTDNYVRGSEGLRDRLTSILEDALRRYGDRVTRVEVSLTDENSDKKQGGNDMRCMLEARLAGVPSIAVNCHAPTLDAAIDGAVDKLLLAIERRVGPQRDHKGRIPMSGVHGIPTDSDTSEPAADAEDIDLDDLPSTDSQLG